MKLVKYKYTSHASTLSATIENEHESNIACLASLVLKMKFMKYKYIWHASTLSAANENEHESNIISSQIGFLQNLSCHKL